MAEMPTPRNVTRTSQLYDTAITWRDRSQTLGEALFAIPGTTFDGFRDAMVATGIAPAEAESFAVQLLSAVHAVSAAAFNLTDRCDRLGGVVELMREVTAKAQSHPYEPGDGFTVSVTS
jgi:hypothetical protein